MGLDMYFYLRKWESKGHWDDDQSKVLDYDDALKELEKDIYERNFKSTETSYQVGYFRKFNALHNYIVNEFAKGVDECQKIYLDITDIKDLIQTLKSITKDNASQVLPTQSGFFFGSLEYDEWYFKDVEYAIELFEKVLKVLETDNKGKWDFYYQASW